MPTNRMVDIRNEKMNKQIAYSGIGKIFRNLWPGISGAARRMGGLAKREESHQSRWNGIQRGRSYRDAARV
jgi:hypothetical protein